MSSSRPDPIDASYVLHMVSAGPVYARLCERAHGPLFIPANASFGGSDDQEILGPATLPSEQWALPQFPPNKTPSLIAGDTLFKHQLLPLTVEVQVVPASGAPIFLVPAFPSIGALVSHALRLCQVDGRRRITPHVIKLSPHTLAEMLRYNGSEQGILYADAVEAPLYQVRLDLLRYLAWSGGPPEISAPRRRYNRIQPLQNAEFAGLNTRRRGATAGVAQAARVFDSAAHRPITSTSVTYRRRPLPEGSVMPLSEDIAAVLG